MWWNAALTLKERLILMKYRSNIERKTFPECQPQRHTFNKSVFKHCNEKVGGRGEGISTRAHHFTFLYWLALAFTWFFFFYFTNYFFAKNVSVHVHMQVWTTSLKHIEALTENSYSEQFSQHIPQAGYWIVLPLGSHRKRIKQSSLCIETFIIVSIE